MTRSGKSCLHDKLMTMHTADLQKATKRTAKGHLSEAKKLSFGRQKDTFCKHTHNQLIFKTIHNV
ncbi:unknown [Prevotella sp. CAG:255]|nr:unknown [Prevotella sp. CAG:255]